MKCNHSYSGLVMLSSGWWSPIAWKGENVINLLNLKVAQNITVPLGYFIFSKNHEPKKVAEFAKNAQSGHPDRGIKFSLQI